MIKQTDRKQESMPGSSKNKELLLTLGGGEMEKKKKVIRSLGNQNHRRRKASKKTLSTDCKPMSDKVPGLWHSKSFYFPLDKVSFKSESKGAQEVSLNVSLLWHRAKQQR